MQLLLFQKNRDFVNCKSKITPKDGRNIQDSRVEMKSGESLTPPLSLNGRRTQVNQLCEHRLCIKDHDSCLISETV